MKKLATSPAHKDYIELNKSATDHLNILAKCLDCSIEELVVVVIAHPRHKELIQEIRNTEIVCATHL